jgi:hypothetical protein
MKIFATAKARATQNKVTATENSSANAADNHEDGTAILASSTNRKLENDFEGEVLAETEEQRKFRELIEYNPSFDLGFDTSQSHEHEQKESGQETQGPGATIEEPAIISSNDSGDSLDKIFASIEMPTSIPFTDKGKAAQNDDASPDNPNSCTPVPQQRRVVKLGPKQKSPYVANDKRPTIPKSDAELYNKVCAYGGKSKDDLNDERLIDYGHFYISLRDLADSIRPEAWLSNSTCEIALIALSKEMAKQRKHIMPLRLAVSIIPYFSSVICLLYIFL